MTTDMIKLLANGGTAAITLFMAWMFLRYMQDMVCSFKKERQEFLQTINNHINNNSKAINDMEKTMNENSRKQTETIKSLDSSITVLSRVMDKILDKL